MNEGVTKYRILVADDSDLILSTIEFIFASKKLNYELLKADNGREACKLAAKHVPDLILMDWVMPKMTGVTAIKVLKRLSVTQNIPIVIMTSEKSLHEAFDAGAFDFLYKPFDEFELLFRINTALTLSETIKKLKLQNELQLKQSDEFKRQYKKMEEHRKDIIDDITYSRRIQNAIMPHRDYLLTLFNEYFIYYKPKRIVSGDFYWVTHKQNKIIVAVADCTGHGISGAFLTIAGTAFLNEIINFIEYDASEILNELRFRIMRLLHQKGVEGEATDGMDISLCIFDFEQMKLEYAGANNPTYIVRTDSTLEICYPDRMPIGIHEHYNKPFNVKTVNLNKGDMVYMLTDGYADQFGGTNDQKFRYKRLQSLCVDVHQKPLADQYKEFERTMDEWIGHRDQIDDMLLLGIRI